MPRKVNSAAVNIARQGRLSSLAGDPDSPAADCQGGGDIPCTWRASLPSIGFVYWVDAQISDFAPGDP